MLKFNMWMHYLGMALTIFGMVVGLPFLILSDSKIGEYMVTMLVPAGFLLWFTGFTAYTLIRPSEEQCPDARKAQIESERFQRQVPD